MATITKKRSLLSTLAVRTTAMVSVSLVLLVLGITALAGVMSARFTADLRSRAGFTVILTEDAGTSGVKQMMQDLRKAPYVASVRYVSPQAALERWQQATGEKEDIVELLGENPFRPEFDVRVRPGYAGIDSLRALSRRMAERPIVDRVRLQSQVMQSIDRFTGRVYIVGLILAGALLVISLVLINNMVRLTVYARRFIINTMQLVGATEGYIRRPFLLATVMLGLFSGLAADVVLGIGIAWLLTVEPQLAPLLPSGWIALVLGANILLGVLICGVSAWVAVNRYLRIDPDRLYD